MPGFVVVRVRREFQVPLAQAFQWLTDYQDDDPARTEAVVKHRPVLERTADRVVLDGTLEILGRKGRGKAEVRLFPPDHYVATIVEGSGRGSVYDYKLSPTPQGCRLDVTYNIHVRRLRRRVGILLRKGAIARELHRMWDGFEASMAQDLAPTRRTAAARP